MKVLFRTDASLRIGTGHVMRCLTLAEVLRKRGAESAFICREFEGDLIRYIRDTRGFPVHALPRSSAPMHASRDGDLPVHHAWLEADWSADAAQTARHIGGQAGRVDWLVVDHYALDARWQAGVRSLADRLLIIDDIADRPHLADYLLDQNLYDGPEARYASRVPSEARLLLGPEFALLRPEFAEARRNARPRDGQVDRILVFFGGADPGNATALAVEALSRAGFSHLAADVVVGAVNPNKDAVQAACARRPGTDFHCQAGNMAELMAKADLALGAGGTTSWERCCLGLPTLTASVAENQRELTATLARHGVLHDLGWGGDLTVESIASALRTCLGDPGRLAAMSRLGLAIVDGLGADRVADRMTASPNPDARTLRPARASDMLTYFRWTNEVETRKHSFQSEPVPLASHAIWFTARLADPDSRLLVAECGGEPAGQIRFQREGENAWIGFSVDPRYRGRGLGAYLLVAGARALREAAAWRDCLIKGAVKATNPASRKAFMKAGFVEAGEATIHGESSFIYHYQAGKS